MSIDAKWADKITRELASRSCEKPVDEDIDCGDVYICGGICLSCLARKYTEQHPSKEA